MSNFWQPEFWIEAFWQAGFWGEEITPQPQPSGSGRGFLPEKKPRRDTDNDVLICFLL